MAKNQYVNGRMYNNPYLSSENNKEERQKYFTFRHFTKKYPNTLSREEIIKLCENRDYKRYEIYRNEDVVRKRLATMNKNLVVKREKGEIGFYYPVSDKEGILEENKRYILYKDKVWSKGQDRYLKPITNSKGIYCLLYTSPADEERRYEKYYISP